MHNQEATRMAKSAVRHWAGPLIGCLVGTWFLFNGCRHAPEKDLPPVPASHRVESAPAVRRFELHDSVVYTAARPKPALLTFPTDTVPVARFEANENTHFIPYGVENGLAHSSVWCSYYDKKGNLWIGTNGGGISRFDGAKFTNFSVANGLASNTVPCITEDHEGHIWVGTYAGLSRFDGQTIMGYPFPGETQDIRVNALAVDASGTLWIGTEKGLYTYYKRKGLHSFSLPLTPQGKQPAIRSLLITQQGHKWVGTNHQGVIELTEQGALLNRFDSTHARIFRGQIYSIIEDYKKNIWFASDVNGIAAYTPGTQTFTGYNQHDGLADNTIHALHQDRQHRIWVGSWGKGVSMLDPEKPHSAFTNYTVKNGLSDDWISTISEDHRGNIWFGTFNKGLSQFRGNSLKSYGKAKGLPGSVVCSITEDTSGNICLGMDGDGIAQFNKRTFKICNLKFKSQKQSETYWSVLCDHQGIIWYATRNNGVCAYQNGRFKQYTTQQGLPSNIIWSIKEDSDQKLWFGTGNGISCYDGKSFRNYFPKTAGKSSSEAAPFLNVIRIFQDKAGGMWFGTLGKGLIHFSGNSCYRYTKEEGLLSNMVYEVMQDKDGNMLIGTEAGINMFKFNNKDFAHPFISKITTENGLPDNCVRHIIPMDTGRIIVSTNKGLALFGWPADISNGQALPTLECFNINTGYAISSINPGQNSLFKDRKGVLWFGDRSVGLSRMDYREVPHNSTRPSLVIETVKLNQKEVPWNSVRHFGDKDTLMRRQKELFYYGRRLYNDDYKRLRIKYSDIIIGKVADFSNLPNHIILPYSNNNLTFVFNSAEVDRHDLVQYQYKLDGYDKEWSAPTKSNSATFGNLSEGKYDFKIKACSPEGIWGPVIQYRFKVLAPWYRTWWAYVLYFSMITGVVVLIFQARTATLRHRQKILKQTVADKTVELTTKNKAIEGLLLNILPQEVVEELQLHKSVKAKSFDSVTVLFTDFKDFTKIAERLDASELVEDLNCFFEAFDEITERYGVEKIKTIGDSYMAVGGLPTVSADHAVNVVRAALEMRDFMLQVNKERAAEEKAIYEIRIGIHSGSVVAGIVGKRKYAYDVWGDCVNVASRMESSGEAMKVNISERTYQLVKDNFQCIYRGPITAKHGLIFDMYFVER